MDAVARDLHRLNPSARGQAVWARLFALDGMHQPPEVIARFAQAQAGALRDPVALSMWQTAAAGDFTAFLALDLAAARRVPPLTEAAFMRARALTEAGEPARAGALALEALQSAALAERPVDLASDATPYLLELARTGGALSAADAELQKNAWVEGWRTRLGADGWVEAGPLIWVMAHSTLGRPDEARAAEAFKARTDFGPEKPLEFFLLKSLEDGHPYAEDLGALHFGAGHLDQAQQLLERWEKACSGNPLSAPRATTALLLGQLAEQRGQVAQACTAFESAARAWRHAVPRSVTVDRAIERRRALGCPVSVEPER